MDHIIVDEISVPSGNFIKETEKKFAYVEDHFFKLYSESNFDTLHNKRNNLDLTGDRIKVLIEASPAPFHYITGIFGAIANALDMFDNPLIVINVSKIRPPFCNQSLVQFFYYFLEDNNIDYICVDSVDDVRILLDNFYLFPFAEYTIPNSINKIHNMFLKYVKNNDITPTKKVYISRRRVNSGAAIYQVPDKNYLIRIDDEVPVENFFKSNGFEIVYPEDFKSLKEQINYFYNVKTIASISGGGAINLIFMQSGSNVIELISPLFSPIGEEDLPEGKMINNWVIAHHNFFSNIAYKRELNYIGISNPEKKSSMVLNKIINSKAAMSIIKENTYD